MRTFYGVCHFSSLYTLHRGRYMQIKRPAKKGPIKLCVSSARFAAKFVLSIEASVSIEPPFERREPAEFYGERSSFSNEKHLSARPPGGEGRE